MTDLRAELVCIKFCFKLGKTAAETRQAFDENSSGQTQTYDWYKRFRNCGTSIGDDACLGRRPTGVTPENVAKVRDHDSARS
jgi:hypothetical protein